MPNNLLRLLLLSLLSFAAMPSQADIVIASNSVCTYFKGTNEASSPISAWRTRDFDDSSWLRGTNALYYGTTGSSYPLAGNTLLSDMRSNYSCVFIRQAFVITNLAQVTNLSLTSFYKDGFVAWINGVEAKRSGTFTNAIPYYTNYARNPTANISLLTGGVTNYTLYLGTNVLAIQAFVARFTNTTSGLSFNDELNGGFKDTTSPWVQSMVPPAGSTVTNLTQLSMTFSEAVTNVLPGSLQINGVNALMVSGAGSNYTFSFRVPPAGLASVNWNPTNQIMDLSSNLLVGPSSWQYTWVVIPPVVTALNPPAGLTLTNLTQINVTFSVVVANVMPYDLLINGSEATAVTGSGSNYIFIFDQPASSPVNVNWDPLNEITDLAGIPLSTGLPWQYILPPPAIIATASPAAGATVNRLTQVAVSFNLPVTGVVASVLLVNGQAATNVSGSGSGPYLFQFLQPTPGLVQFSWAANQHIRQAAAFTNLFAGQSWTMTFDPALVFADVVINEFLAANISAGGLTDEDGDLSPWIELYNRGPGSANLTGWSLSNDPNNPGLWLFPSTNLAAGRYLVIFASGKDRSVAGARLHTSFQLASRGDYLGLFRPQEPDWQVVCEFAPQYPEQRNDYSYGLNSSNQWRYFRTPTPGAANGDSAITDALPPVHFNVQHGFFNAPFTLTLGVTAPGANIRFTTDGSQPTESNGTDYTNALTINHTTTLRAAAFQTNKLPSLVQTATYLFPGDVIHQSNNQSGVYTNLWGTFAPDYEMDPRVVTSSSHSNTIKGDLMAVPTLSVVLAPDDIFGAVNGIYTHAGATYRAPLWERACSLELICPDGTQGFQVDCGVKLQGGGSREQSKEKKHPLAVQFKGIYGPGKLNYPFFPDSPVTDFDTIYLRSDYNNHWTHMTDNLQRARGTLIRDAFFKDVHAAMGALSLHSTYVHLYINGLYWGLYNPSERADGHFGAAYMGGDQTDYDAFNGSAPSPPVDGDTVARNTLLSLAGNNLAVQTNYEAIKQYLNIPQYIDYMILQIYGANQDWGTNKNWYSLRKRQAGAGFYYMTWDSERTLEAINGLPMGVTSVPLLNSVSPDNLQTNLVANPEYRLAFADRVYKHFFNNGALTLNQLLALWKVRAAQIDRAIVGESARWGDVWNLKDPISPLPYPSYTTTLPYTREENWLGEQGRLFTNYFPFRSGVVLAQLRTVGLYPAIDTPTYNQQGGNVTAGFRLTMSAPAGTIYYTSDGSDPRVYGSGTVSPTASTYSSSTPIILNSSAVVKARALSSTTWSALNEASFTVASLGSPLRITELMYNPIGGNNYEFLEIMNTGAFAVDLSAYSFSGISFVFPEGTVINAGQRLVLANNGSQKSWTKRYPGVTPVGWYGKNLSDTGERIALIDAAGRTIFSVTYDIANGWPTLANGQGYSLEMMDVNGDPNDPANWRASTAPNGTPGQPPAAPAIVTSVVINEVMAENVSAVPNAGTYPDWVELFNTSSNDVDLTGWSLSDNGTPRQFVFPVTHIAAGGFLVVWCDDATNTSPGLHAGFALNKEGDQVFLYDNFANRMDGISFGAQLPDDSIGRVNGAWQLTVPTPGAGNVAATVVSAANLVINEWMANAVPGGSDWLELYNRSSNGPAALRDIYLGTSNRLLQVKSLSFVPAGGFIQLLADELPGPGHLDFKLPAEGGAIYLYNPTGVPVDQVVYGAQIQGVSQGRLPNGSANIVSFAGTASPGASNYLANYTGPVLNEVLARNQSGIVSPWGDFSDFVEIRNSSASAYDLSGMSLSTDASTPGVFVFPAGTIMAANSYLAVWCENARPVSTMAGGAMNSGLTLDGTSGGVYLFNALGQLVNFVEYGFQVPNLSIGLSAGAWKLLAAPTPGATNSSPAALGAAAQLRLNEWMAAPLSGNDWFELYNLDPLPVDMSGMYLTDDPSIIGQTNTQVAPLSFIGGKSWTLWQADNHLGDGRNHVNFALDEQGEMLGLYDANLNLIDAVSFGQQSPGVSQGRLPDGSANIVGFATSASPEQSNYLPLPEVVFNEVLTHPGDGFTTAIELFNNSSNAVTIGNWFLSDSPSNLKKDRIVSGLKIPPYGFALFGPSQFGPGGDGPSGFVLSADLGGTLYLSESDTDDNLSGRRTMVSFGAAESGVSLGRFPTSVGVDFVGQSQLSLGATNVYPKVGPVVINELMYHPVTLSGTDLVENHDEEYVELYNPGSSPVPLYDPAHPTNTWRLAGGVRFTFPSNTIIPASGYLLVVDFDPISQPDALQNFLGKYGTYGTVVGPYNGHLADEGESIELYKPDAPVVSTNSDNGYVPYVLVDQVIYGNQPPWPTEANGDGMSLQRIAPALYGNEPLNWVADWPTAGRTNAPVLPPRITVQPGRQVVLPGATVTFTVTADGTPPLVYHWFWNNLEVTAGTNGFLVVSNVQPAAAGLFKVVVMNSAGLATSSNAELVVLSPLSLSSMNFQMDGSFQFNFGGLLNQTYAIDYSTNLQSPWMELARLVATNQAMQFLDTGATNQPCRFYRIRLIMPPP